MTTKHFFAMAGCLYLLTACVPQAEYVKMRAELSDVQVQTRALNLHVREIQKRFDDDVEKRLDLLNANVKGTGDVQKLLADSNARSDQLATDIQLLQGKLEENNFRIVELAQKFDDKSVKLAELAARTDDLEAKVKPLSSGTPTAAPEGDKKSAPRAPEPSEAYRQAKSDFDKGNFDLALAGFQNYLARYPETNFAPAAQYWIGECYYSKKDFTRAIEAFETVIKNYPKSDKIPGAKLKIGLTNLQENNTTRAKEYFNKVIREHRNTNEAAIAADQLKKIRK